MEFWLTYLGYVIALIVGVVAFFVGLHKNRSEILHTMQKTMSSLVAENKELTKRQIEANKKLIHLEKENALLKRIIEDMSAKLENVKTITRTK